MTGRPWVGRGERAPGAHKSRRTGAGSRRTSGSGVAEPLQQCPEMTIRCVVRIRRSGRGLVGTPSTVRTVRPSLATVPCGAPPTEGGRAVTVPACRSRSGRGPGPRTASSGRRRRTSSKLGRSWRRCFRASTVLSARTRVPRPGLGAEPGSEAPGAEYRGHPADIGVCTVAATPGLAAEAARPCIRPVLSYRVGRAAADRKGSDR